jgi:hypothetical protein
MENITISKKDYLMLLSKNGLNASNKVFYESLFDTEDNKIKHIKLISKDRALIQMSCIISDLVKKNKILEIELKNKIKKISILIE